MILRKPLRSETREILEKMENANAFSESIAYNKFVERRVLFGTCIIGISWRFCQRGYIHGQPLDKVIMLGYGKAM